MRILELRTPDGRCVARHVHMACSFQSRCLGLLSRTNLPDKEGLLLIPGGSIHTLGMRFPIDVVFLNRQMRVLALAECVRPWRIRVAPRGTRLVLELAAGQIAATRLTTGTFLIVESASPSPPDESERYTVRLSHMRVGLCERQPIQFSLRLPVERRCARVAQEKCSDGVIGMVTSLGRPRPAAVSPAAAPPEV